jgi:hypothetical protein
MIIDDAYRGISVPKDKIIFYSLNKRGEDYSLLRREGTYISDLDGSNVRNIIRSSFGDYFSKDGNFLLVRGHNDLEGCIYNIDNNKIIVCSKNLPEDGRFSPDGKLIVSDKARQITKNHKDSICIVNFDGSNFKVIKKDYEVKVH